MFTLPENARSGTLRRLSLLCQEILHHCVRIIVFDDTVIIMEIIILVFALLASHSLPGISSISPAIDLVDGATYDFLMNTKMPLVILSQVKNNLGSFLAETNIASNTTEADIKY